MTPLPTDAIKDIIVCVLKFISRTKIVYGIIDNALIIKIKPITRITSHKIGSLKNRAMKGDIKINKYKVIDLSVS